MVSPAHELLLQLSFDARRQLFGECVDSEKGFFLASSCQGKTGGPGSYACLFGRDSLITSLLLLERARFMQDTLAYGHIAATILENARTQGRVVNVCSGEQPGKNIHELRTRNHEHLTRDLTPPWYVYPDRVMRMYDTADATALFLIAAYRYWQATRDEKFLAEVYLAVTAALQWMEYYGDQNNDGFQDYSFPEERERLGYGGLQVQSWNDSPRDEGELVVYPIAPAEVQAYMYLALVLWEKFYHYTGCRREAYGLQERAFDLRTKFNRLFVLNDGVGLYVSPECNGAGQFSTSIRSSMAHCLWASLIPALDAVHHAEGILFPAAVPRVVERLMRSEMFRIDAGIRTLATYDPFWNPARYHQGSFWPHDNALAYLGFRHHGFDQEASRVASAVAAALAYFNAPGMELYCESSTGGALVPFWRTQAEGGTPGNSVQTWSLAGVLAMAAGELGGATA
jgi:glycogen debranching enzyme